jgi:hypothetical protein
MQGALRDLEGALRERDEAAARAADAGRAAGRAAQQAEAAQEELTKLRRDAPAQAAALGEARAAVVTLEAQVGVCSEKSTTEYWHPLWYLHASRAA